MQFYAISILLYRPFFSRAITKARDIPQMDVDDPRAICVSSAQSIIKLLRIYQKQHTLRRTNVHIVHLIFTASLICVYNTCFENGAAASNSIAEFQFCCQAMGEIGQAYQNATRALEVIICIKRDWFSKSRNWSRPNKRASVVEIDAAPALGRKRRLTDNQSSSSPPNSMWFGSMMPFAGMQDSLGSQNGQQINSWQFPVGNNDYQQVNESSMFGCLFTSAGDSGPSDFRQEQFKN